DAPFLFHKMAMAQLKANSMNPEESREKGNSKEGRVLQQEIKCGSGNSQNCYCKLLMFKDCSIIIPQPNAFGTHDSSNQLHKL
ncbi:hypothetical protein A2U01_0014547, partial [Trifolium medium]|nr:hypothetical protein [Trifolium medium]